MRQLIAVLECMYCVLTFVPMHAMISQESWIRTEVASLIYKHIYQEALKLPLSTICAGVIGAAALKCMGGHFQVGC